MLPANSISSEAQRREALARVYALLIRMADNEEIACPENISQDTAAAKPEQLTPKGDNNE